MTDFYEVSGNVRKLKDVRVTLFELGELLVGAFLIALFVRLFLFQAFEIPAGSMEGTLLPGDRVFGNRIVYGLKVPFTDRVILPFKDVVPGDVVIFRDPRDPARTLIRRCVASSGMKLRITAKTALVNGAPFPFPPSARPGDAFQIEGRYSPRDNLPEFKLPEKGESVSLDGASLMCFDFYASLIRQENPGARISVTSDLMRDGRVCSDLRIPELKMEMLKSDSTPDFDAMDWIGLNNVLNFLAARNDTAVYGFRRTLYMDGERTGTYEVRGRCFFVIGDNWDESFDSRYFGFVSESLAVARGSFIFWSSRQGQSRWKRLFLFI